MDQKNLDRVRAINRALPFADPIAQGTTWEERLAAHPRSIWIAKHGFDPAAPTMRDLESWRRIDADFLIDGML